MLEISDLLYTTKRTLTRNKKRLEAKSKIFELNVGISNLLCTTKYTLSWNKIHLKNKSESSDLYSI